MKISWMKDPSYVDEGFNGTYMHGNKNGLKSL